MDSGRQVAPRRLGKLQEKLTVPGRMRFDDGWTNMTSARSHRIQEFVSTLLTLCSPILVRTEASRSLDEQGGCTVGRHAHNAKNRTTKTTGTQD